MKTHCLIRLGALLLLSSLPVTSLRAENPQFRERMAAWQSPQRGRVEPAAWEEEAPPLQDSQASHFVEESVDEWTSEDSCAGGSCAGGCGLGGGCQSACCPDRCGRCMDWSLCGGGGGPRLWWFRKDGLLFWRKGRDLPPLVTTSDTAVPPPGTDVLFGDRTESSNARAGLRLDFGTWLTFDECVGIGARVWGLGNDDSTFALSSTDLPGQTIERPFIQSPDTQNSLVIADPFTGFSGNISVATRSEVFGGDLYARIRCHQSCASRTDFITGYQFTRINESLRIHSNTQEGTLIVDDNYSTYNEFHGGILGVLHEADCGCLNLQLLARVALGNMRQTAVATGLTNGQSGGLLVETDATIVRDTFSAAPEFGATLGYRFSPCMEVHAGYTLLHWGNIARPEEIIDNVRGNGTSIVLNDTGFWVQGFHAGLTTRF